MNRYRAQYSKRTKKCTPVPIPKPKTYAYMYIPELMELICAKVCSVEGPVDQPLGLAPEDPRNIAQNRFVTPHPNMEELLTTHKSRFQ